MNSEFYFAQLTDIHVGQGLNPIEAANNLKWALQELELISPKPKLILVTADLVCAGKKVELLEYSELVKGYSIPMYSLPANHDLWGESDDSAWLEIIGPLKNSVIVDDVHFLLWNETQRRNGNWVAELREEQRDWFIKELNKTSGKPVIIAQHCPPLPINDSYHDRWNNSNADEMLDLISQYNTLAITSGHWHRNGEWTAKGIRIINTGALCGWQWNGTPPHYCFPVRPGYRLFNYDGKILRDFWRDGSYWQTPAPKVQVMLVSINNAHTGGPRPQVRSIDVFGKAMLKVTAYAQETEIAKVEWSLTQKDWQPMERSFNGIWSEWQAEINPTEFRCMGEQVCIIRAEGANKAKAYDAVPLRLSEKECSTSLSSAYAGRESLFDLFYLPS